MVQTGVPAPTKYPGVGRKPALQSIDKSVFGQYSSRELTGEGGRGAVLNVLLGALIVRLIFAAVALGGIPGSFESIVIGGILLAMLLFEHALGVRPELRLRA